MRAAVPVFTQSRVSIAPLAPLFDEVMQVRLAQSAASPCRLMAVLRPALGVTLTLSASPAPTSTL